MSYLGTNQGDVGTILAPPDGSVTAAKLDAGLTSSLSGKEVATNKDASGGYVGRTLYKINLPNNANTYTSVLQNTNTAVRTYTSQDKDGTFSHTSDVHDASAKTTPVDADELGLQDSAASYAIKKVTWANYKATLKTYNDTLYGALGTTNVWSVAQRGTINLLTDASTVAVDMSAANFFNLKIGGNRTLGAPSNAVSGQQGCINIYQDTTGSRTLAYAWIYSWAGATAGVLSTAGCSRDMLSYSVDFYGTGTVTTTIATPAVLTLTSHGFISGHKSQMTTTGALPTGFTASTTYYIHVIDANTFHLCTTLANVAAGTYIATTGSQSGVHTIIGGTITLALSKAII